MRPFRGRAVRQERSRRQGQGRIWMAHAAARSRRVVAVLAVAVLLACLQPAAASSSSSRRGTSSRPSVLLLRRFTPDRRRFLVLFAARNLTKLLSVSLPSSPAGAAAALQRVEMAAMYAPQDLQEKPDVTKVRRRCTAAPASPCYCLETKKRRLLSWFFLACS